MTLLNLANDPWITVVRTDGTVDTASLRDLFSNSSTIRSIETGWSMSDNSVFDIALAIAYRALDLSDEPGSTSSQKASAYLSHPERIAEEVGLYLDKWQEHFDIEVFGQVNVPDVSSAKETVSIESIAVVPDRMALELSSGGFDHHKLRPGAFRSLSNVLGQSVEQTALDLVTTYRADLTKPGSALPGSQFDMLDAATKKGRTRPDDGILAGRVESGSIKTGKRGMGGLGLVHYPRLVMGGANLAQTIIFNMPPQSREQKSRDVAMWETDYRTIDSRTKVGFRGYADWLTYQSRAIQTFWEGGRLSSVVVAPNNFRLNSGATGSHESGDFSDKTGTFYASSPFLVCQYRKPPAKTSMETFIQNDTLEKFRPMVLPVEIAWMGLTAFTADNSGEITPETVIRGANSDWLSRLVSDGVISDSDSVSVTYLGTARGPNDTSFLIGYEDTYSISGWLASPGAEHMRATIDTLVRRAQTVRDMLFQTECSVVRAVSHDGKRKLNSREVGLGVAQHYTGLISQSFHRLVAQASEGTQRELARKMAKAIEEAATVSIERIATAYPAEKIATTGIPMIVERARFKIVATIQGEKPPTDKNIAKELREQAVVDDAEPWRKEISAFTNARIGRARKDTALRVDFANIGRSIDPRQDPLSVLGAFKDWSEAVKDREQADVSVQSALGIWGLGSGASRDISGGVPVFVVARGLSGKSDAVTKYVRSVLSTTDRKLLVYHLSSLIRLLSSLRQRPAVNFGDLAADLYEFSTSPKTVQYRWARQFSIGKAS